MTSDPQDDPVAFFAARGFEVRIERRDQSEKFRLLGLSDAATVDDPFWLDLVRSGRVVAPDYGSGSSENEALQRAMQRWVVEQDTEAD